MYIVYYDSGTTNTRAYLLRDGAILQKVSRPVGARNSALSGDRDELLRALAAMYQDSSRREWDCGSPNIRHLYVGDDILAFRAGGGGAYSRSHRLR